MMSPVSLVAYPSAAGGPLNLGSPSDGATMFQPSTVSQQIPMGAAVPTSGVPTPNGPTQMAQLLTPGFGGFPHLYRTQYGLGPSPPTCVNPALYGGYTPSAHANRTPLVSLP